jgi:hypothetical protein
MSTDQVECLHRERLVAEYEIAVGEYAVLVSKFGPGFDFSRTGPLRTHLDRLEDEITGHCRLHGCYPDWVQAHGTR